MLKKFFASIAVLFVITFTFSLLTFNSALAADEFLIDSTVEYKIEDSGKTSVKHTINLENAFSTLYAKEYSLVLEGIEIANPQVLSEGQPLKFDLNRENGKVTFKIFFDTP